MTGRNVLLFSLILWTSACGYGVDEFVVPGTTIRVEIPKGWINLYELQKKNGTAFSALYLDEYTNYGFLKTNGLEEGLFNAVLFSTIENDVEDPGMEGLVRAHVLRTNMLSDKLVAIEGDCPTLVVSSQVNCFTQILLMKGKEYLLHQYFFVDNGLVVSIKVIRNTIITEELNEILASVKQGGCASDLDARK